MPNNSKIVFEDIITKIFPWVNKIYPECGVFMETYMENLTYMEKPFYWMEIPYPTFYLTYSVY